MEPMKARGLGVEPDHRLLGKPFDQRLERPSGLDQLERVRRGSGERHGLERPWRANVHWERKVATPNPTRVAWEGSIPTPPTGDS